MAQLYQFSGIRLAAELVYMQKELSPGFAGHKGHHVFVPADLVFWPQTSQEQAMQRPLDCE